jgi:hypothetical protein
VRKPLFIFPRTLFEIEIQPPEVLSPLAIVQPNLIRPQKLKETRMLGIKLDANGEYQVVWDPHDVSVIALGKAYSARENSLPVAEQLKAPTLACISQALQTAVDGLEASTAGEMQRAEAATRFHTAMTEATPLLDLAIERLKGKYASDLGSLRRWGLETKIGARGKVTVSKPKTETKWADFLLAYVQRETELPEADRITDPPLARIADLSATAETNRAARQTGSIQRQAGTQTRSVNAAPLLDLLQVARGVLVVTRFGGTVTEDLSAWGYQVVRRTSKTPLPPGEAEPTA